MDFGHEGMEMHATLATIRETAEKSIHQKAFTASYAAIKIESFRYLGGTQATAEKTVAFAFEHHQLGPQTIQIFNGSRLGFVADEVGLFRCSLIPSQWAVVFKWRWCE